MSKGLDKLRNDVHTLFIALQYYFRLLSAIRVGRLVDFMHQRIVEGLPEGGELLFNVLVEFLNAFLRLHPGAGFHLGPQR